MCGLTGILSFSGVANRRTLQGYVENMAQTLSHRGPDDQGTWQDPDAPIVLAHRRLSILDLSPEGHQPMSAASGRYVMVFNGEIYNFADLRAPLEKSGHVFRGRSDTEILLAAIDQWGLNATIQKISGMFAIALWDRQEKTLHLIRDRMGKKPLYVGWAGRDLVFGSELKALSVHPDFRPDIDRSSLAGYLRTGFVSAPHCIYQKVWSLPPASRMTLTFEDLSPGESLMSRIEPYWSAASAVSLARLSGQAGNHSESGALDSFDSVFESSVRDRMIADVPLGALLSGGLDSSAVAAMMQRLSPRPVKTYTIGFDENGFDESASAAKIAAHLGTEHHEARMTGAQALEIVPRLPDLYDEPFADASAIPTILLCAFARRDVTVALSGDGGDEMFGGYHRHVTGARIWSRSRWFPAPLRRLIAQAITARAPSWWDARLPRVPQAGQKLHKAAAAFAFNDPAQIHLGFLSHWPDPASLVSGVQPPDFEPFLSMDLLFSEEMMVRDALSYLPHDVLVKVDRASMAAGLEARAPFLDGRMFDFAWSLPLEMKIRRNRGKWIIREWLARQMPVSLFERPKQGFTPPIGAWLNGPLRDWAENLLSDSALEDCGLDPRPVRKIWAGHRAGQGDNTMKLWTVLSYAAWHARWGRQSGI